MPQNRDNVARLWRAGHGVANSLGLRFAPAQAVALRAFGARGGKRHILGIVLTSSNPSRFEVCPGLRRLSVRV